MAELMLWNRVKCFFTGGHRYADKNLSMSKDKFGIQCTFTNNCVKCGKTITCKIPQKALDRILELDLKNRRAEDGK